MREYCLRQLGFEVFGTQYREVLKNSAVIYDGHVQNLHFKDSMNRQHSISGATAAIHRMHDFSLQGFFRDSGANIQSFNARAMLAPAHSARPISAWIKRTVLALMWMEDAGCQATKMSLRPQGTRKRSLSQHTNERPRLRGLAAHACVNKGESQAPQAVEMQCCICGQPAAPARKEYPKC